MTITKINSQNSLINRLAFGDHVEPPSSENHVDIIEKGIGFNVYYDEEYDRWLSCNPSTNYVIKFFESGNKELTFSFDKVNPYGTEVNFTNKILFDNNGTVFISGDRKTIFNYTENSNLTIEESGGVITNKDSTAIVILTLPAITADIIGIYYWFHVKNGSELLKVFSAVGDYIYKLGPDLYETIESNDLGASVKLVCVAIGKWGVESLYGNWSFF